jgi:RNA polymerase sigma-70 factor (ECF subfamily)
MERIVGLLARGTESADPLHVVERHEEQRAVIAALALLPVKERAALTLRYLEDLDERSIAEMLGWPIGTVKTRLHRGRDRLRQSLQGVSATTLAPDSIGGQG